MSQTFKLPQFVIITLITSIWVNASEVFRYFLFVKPALEQRFLGFEGIAPMDWGVFAIWGFWDTLLTAMTVFMFWLFSQKYGNTMHSIFASGTLSWLFFFMLFWIGMVNMGLADWSLAILALGLSWLELTLASFIASILYRRANTSRSQEGIRPSLS